MEEHLGIFELPTHIWGKALSLTNEVRWEKHKWGDGYKITEKEDDLSIGGFFNGEADFLMPWVEKFCAEHSQNLGCKGSLVSKYSYPARWNRYGVGHNMDPHFDYIRYIFDGNNKGVPIFSIIILLNDDFEGGELTFRLGGPKLGKVYTPKLNAGNVIIWPSGYMFEHWVTPVTSGTRYTIAHWAY